MKMEALTSAKNPLLKAVRRALARGTLTGDGLCVAEGVHLLEEAFRSGCDIAAIFIAESAQELAEERREPAEIRAYTLPDTLFHEISSTESSQGIVFLVRPRTWTLDETMAQEGLTVVLDGVQEPGNAGAIVRTAEAFGAAGVVFLKGTVSPYNAKALRASAGSLFRFPHTHNVEEAAFRTAAEQNGLCMFAADSCGNTLLHEANLANACAVIIGSEGRGITPLLLRDCVGLRIRTRAVESLNAAVAAAVILYEAQRQRMGR